MKASEWLARGQTAGDAFDALSNCWKGFNNLFAGKGQERDLIRRFLRERLDEESAWELLGAHPKDLETLLHQPVMDMRGNGKDTAQYVEQFSASAAAVDQLVALFMVIYQVRCNLEHGQKSPSRERHESLCAAASTFVADVVGRTAA